MVDLVGLLVPLAGVGAWQLLVSTGVLNYSYLPAPVEVGESLVALATSGELATDLAHTLAIVGLAAALALALGGALGFAIGSLPPVRTYLMASVDFLRTIPAVALLPVALLSFGPGPNCSSRPGPPCGPCWSTPRAPLPPFPRVCTTSRERCDSPGPGPSARSRSRPCSRHGWPEPGSPR